MLRENFDKYKFRFQQREKKMYMGNIERVLPSLMNICDKISTFIAAKLSQI